MAGSRRQGREAALQLIYLSDTCRIPLADVPEAVYSEDAMDAKTREFAHHLAEGTIAYQEEIDPLLVRYAANWTLDRMATIDRCILRMASFELLKDQGTPISVVINEAVEIAKKYSTAESSKFVNGILDKIKLERK